MADEEERASPEDEEEADEAPADEGERGADEAAQEEEAADEDNVDETEEDPFELLDEESEDNELEERMYREYLDLMKQIDCQNGIINDLKARSHELRDKPCQTRNERAEYQRLRICLDQENIKLNTMMNRAIQLQNNGSKRLYGSIELATSGFEDSLLNSSSGCRKATKCPASTSRPKTAQEDLRCSGCGFGYGFGFGSGLLLGQALPISVFESELSTLQILNSGIEENVVPLPSV